MRGATCPRVYSSLKLSGSNSEESYDLQPQLLEDYKSSLFFEIYRFFEDIDCQFMNLLSWLVIVTKLTIGCRALADWLGCF